MWEFAKKKQREAVFMISRFLIQLKSVMTYLFVGCHVFVGQFFDGLIH